MDDANDLRYAHEMRPGDRYAPLRFRISAEANEQCLFAMSDYAPQYLGVAQPAEVHPVLLLHMSARTRSPSFRLAPGMGSVFARDKVSFKRKALVDEWLEVHWTLRDVYERKGRLYQGLETRVVNAGGEVVLLREAHSVFFVSTGAPVTRPHD
jgi:hypothetical protein